MTAEAMTGSRPAADVKAWALLNALPHPVVLVEADDSIGAANNAAELFFQASVSVL